MIVGGGTRSVPPPATAGRGGPMDAISEIEVEGAALAEHLGSRRWPLDVDLHAAATGRLRRLLVVPDRQDGPDGLSAHEPRGGADLGRVRQLQRGHSRPADADRGQEYRLLRAAGPD